LKRLAVPAALFLCAFAREQTANGTGPCVFWETRGPHFSINERGSSHLSGPDQFVAVENGFQAWAAPSCTDIAPQYDGTTPRTDVAYDADASINLVIFRPGLCSQLVPDGSPCLAEPGACDDAYNCLDDSFADGIAITFVYSLIDSGVILSSGVQLNDATTLFSTVNGPPCDPSCPWPGDGGEGDGGCLGPPVPPHNTVNPQCVVYDVWNTTAHEAGHFLGFAHTNVPGAVMFPTVSIGDLSKRSLHPDDVDGVCTVYPRDAATSQVCPGYDGGSGSPSGGCGCSGGSGPSAALPLLAVVLLARRRRWSAKSGRHLLAEAR
jgi:MYXO-CTERM domain-containing protein